MHLPVVVAFFVAPQKSSFSQRRRSEVCARWRREFVDCYEVLGVPSTATREEVRAAYYHKAHRLHPDAGGEPCDFKVIANAWATLRDERKRSAHDAARAAKHLAEAADKFVDDVVLKIRHDVVPAVKQGVVNAKNAANNATFVARAAAFLDGFFSVALGHHEDEEIFEDDVTAAAANVVFDPRQMTDLYLKVKYQDRTDSSDDDDDDTHQTNGTSGALLRRALPPDADPTLLAAVDKLFDETERALVQWQSTLGESDRPGASFDDDDGGRGDTTTESSD